MSSKLTYAPTCTRDHKNLSAREGERRRWGGREGREGGEKEKREREREERREREGGRAE